MAPRAPSVFVEMPVITLPKPIPTGTKVLHNTIALSRSRPTFVRPTIKVGAPMTISRYAIPAAVRAANISAAPFANASTDNVAASRASPTTSKRRKLITLNARPAMKPKTAPPTSRSEMRKPTSVSESQNLARSHGAKTVDLANCAAATTPASQGMRILGRLSVIPDAVIGLVLGDHDILCDRVDGGREAPCGT
jgi:hypothetical protein